LIFNYYIFYPTSIASTLAHGVVFIYWNSLQLCPTTSSFLANMANTWKPPKVSLKLTPPKPQANTASKENPAPQTKIMKPAVKAVGNSQPLQMSWSRTSSHGAKDTDTLALLERITLLQGVFFNLFVGCPLFNFLSFSGERQTEEEPSCQTYSQRENDERDPIEVLAVEVG
jgi:hypothetical protein